MLERDRERVEDATTKNCRVDDGGEQPNGFSLSNFLYMRLTDRAIQMFARDLEMEPDDLRNQMDNLDEQFRQSYTQSDWMGCLNAVKKQNRLLGLCPNEPESDQEDWLENVG